MGEIREGRYLNAAKWLICTLVRAQLASYLGQYVEGVPIYHGDCKGISIKTKEIVWDLTLVDNQDFSVFPSLVCRLAGFDAPYLFVNTEITGSDHAP